MALKPIHVDMGAKFPMRNVIHHHRDLLVSGAMVATLFLFLPLSYFYSTGISLNEFAGNWWMPIILLAGLGGIYAFVAAVCDRIVYEIDATGVRMTLRQFLRASGTFTAPLTEYTALWTSKGLEPGFIGDRENYQITLFHGKESHKQVALYLGVKKEIFEGRLVQYQQLFGLPVDPTGLAVLAIQTG